MRLPLLPAALLFSAASMTGAQTGAPQINVLKTAACGCCTGWVEQMDEAGFTLNAQNVSNGELLAAKEATGFSPDLWACHTAEIAGYTVEGHVPAREIERLVSERPTALGIATPGMPVGSPGMDPRGAPGMGFKEGEREAYDVMLVLSDGTAAVYASYPGN